MQKSFLPDPPSKNSNNCGNMRASCRWSMARPYEPKALNILLEETLKPFNKPVYLEFLGKGPGNHFLQKGVSR